VTEICYTWEETYLDRTSTVTAGTYTQTSDTFDLSKADADLGDLVSTDHDRPPLGSWVFGPAFDGTCFIIKDNLLHYCRPKEPEYWPALYYIEVSTPQFPGICGLFHNGQIYYLTSIEIYYIQGTGDGTFLPLPMRAKCGAQGRFGAVSVPGQGIYHVGPDGIYMFGSGTDKKLTEDALEPIFRGTTTNGIPGVGDPSTAWLHVNNARLYFGYASATDTYPEHVLVFNLETGRLAYYTYGVEIRCIANDHTNKRLLVGDSQGYVRVIESSAHTTDNGTVISWEVESKRFELQTRRHFPRWLKYDVDASSATTCTGTLLLDGTTHHTHTIAGSRNTRRRLVEIGNGNTASIRISGTGPATVYAAELE